MRRKGIIGVVIGVMVAIGVVLWMGRDTDRDGGANQPSATTEAADSQSSPAADEEEDVSAETSEDPGTVKRLPNYAAASDSSDLHWAHMELPIRFTGDNLFLLSQQLIDAALDGSAVAALEFASARQHCSSVPATPELFDAQVRLLLEHAARNRERGATYPETSPWRSRPGSPHGSNAEIREREAGWYEACQSLRQLISNGLREDVERLARQGDTAARLLYAMLRPELRGNPSWLEDLEHWERMAREFTDANLAEKRVEGLLGSSIGYSLYGWMFGPHGFDLAMAHWLAAALCGVQHPQLQEVVNHVGQKAGNSVAQAEQDEVVRMAADLHQRYCDSAP